MENKPQTYGGQKIIFEEIDCEADKAKAALYKISGYPTFKLATIKQRFIDTAIIIKNKRLVYIPIQVTADDLLIINLACNLYWNILIYNFDTIVDIIKHKVDKEMLLEDLKEISYKSKGFLDRNYEFTIDNKCINRKAKWAYDICVTIDNIDKKDIIKNIGTLPKIKIIKNG
jgi:hypothetical protein